MKPVIEIKELTKGYSGDRGVFNLSLTVYEGEVMGFLGPNGAGKTTTIRNLMGFIRPQSGSCSIEGHDCFKDAQIIQGRLGYLAGELAFPDDMTGTGLLNYIAALKGVRDKKRISQLQERFDFDPSQRIRRMSKGQKQKVGIIAAFMSDPAVILLDEPTSGLDPLMQNRFIDLISEEKERGKTIFLSSHIFEEVERTCNRVGILRKGRLVETKDIDELKSRRAQRYILTFTDNLSAQQFASLWAGAELNQNTVICPVKASLPELLTAAAKYPVTNIKPGEESLEELFLRFYGGSLKQVSSEE